MTLAQKVRATARAVDTEVLRLVAPHDAGLASQPKTLLTVLAYCYARGIYGSANIEALMRRDPKLRPLGHGGVPDVPMIRRFRRENREALQACLESALRFVAEQKVAQGIITHVNAANLVEEARRRIVTAMFSDSMELDKDHSSDASVDLYYLIAKDQSRTH